MPTQTGKRHGLVSIVALSLLSFALGMAVAQANPIQEENKLPGDPYIELWLRSWWDGTDFSFARDREIEGYASLTSVQAGDTSFGTNNIEFYVNVDNPSLDPTYSLNIFRLGWYGGTGARRMLSVTRTSLKQDMPAENPNNGNLIKQVGAVHTPLRFLQDGLVVYTSLSL